MTFNEFAGVPSVKYVPYGKLVCYITGRLRKDTSEEHVRQRVARSLVEEYGYKKSEIELSFPIMVFSKRYPVDIAVFPEEHLHRQENIFMIIETKKESIRPTDREHGIDQLKSYVGASMNCKYGMWTNGLEKYCFEKVKVGEKYEPQEIIDIPPKGKSVEEYEKLSFTELRPATELKSVFKRCHNYIHGNQGLPKDMAFHELLKVIFCKVYDERESREVRFYVTNAEMRNTLGHTKVKDRIEHLFQEVKNRYGYIFRDEKEIKLEPRVLSYIVGHLQHFSLVRTDTDVKGDAYEAIVGANLRGDRGEFFTPRNVCKMAVGSLFQTFPKDMWHNLKLLDPACGTGGFLIAVINFIRGFFYEEELRRWKDEDYANNTTIDRVKTYCESNVYGIDFNPLLVRVSQMNEVMHGNGSGNLFAVNSLLPPTDWPDDVQARLKLDAFDLVFTNPPFGSEIRIDDPHILAQYDLAHVWREDEREGFVKLDKLRASVPPEQLFIERCLQLLKQRPKGGRLAIVLPDSILSNPGLAYIRHWIMKKAKVLASIDLPRETFQPYVGTKTSVLFLQRKTPEEIRVEEETGHPVDYEVFMSIAEKVGHDRRGNAEYRRTPEGEELVEEVDKEVVRVIGKTKMKERVRVPQPLLADDLPSVTQAFVEWFREKGSTFV